MAHHRHTEILPSQIFPDLEPAARAGFGDRIAAAWNKMLDAVTEDLASALEDPKNNTTASCLTVYAMNGILLIFAFPVGFAMLILNVVGGENLRTTAQILALTGLAMVLSHAEAGARILGLG
jgi:hypothetical protein